MIKKILLSAFILSVPLFVSAQTASWTADNGNGTYTNPIFYDEFSDPDIIRVGEDFYLAVTSLAEPLNSLNAIDGNAFIL